MSNNFVSTLELETAQQAQMTSFAGTHGNFGGYATAIAILAAMED